MPHKSDTKNVLPDAESVPVLASSCRDSRLLPVHTNPPLSSILARPAGSSWLDKSCSILQDRGSHCGRFLRCPGQGLSYSKDCLSLEVSCVGRTVPFLIKLVPQSMICVKAKNIGHNMFSPGPIKESCIVRYDSVRGERNISLRVEILVPFAWLSC